ncbi:BPSL0761 family protein [Paraburkholderia ribeironis]|uniref:BPSL0761 family protein n=1 Tax=Paraburkholderia ribeironis TaxID=1247936 RepID=UPI000B9D529B
MTTPRERTRSVRGTRDLLETLATSVGPINSALARTLAVQLLRHFPSDVDIANSSDALPDIWGPLPNCNSCSPAREQDAGGA